MEQLLDDYYVDNPDIQPKYESCSICNCWITRKNFKRHIFSKKHYRQVEWSLMCGITPIEWEIKEEE